ncbi:MAG: hypothetical protein LUE26_02810 [Alistipes sp.]|nr:hypothetical protein [Alistipes sp.]
MGMIFKFRALSDENDSFARDYELSYDSDLLAFHRLICGDLGFDPSEMASFFLSGPGWDKGAEFTSFDIGAGEEDAPLPMEGTLLGTVIRREKERLIYTFDPFSGRSLYIELLGTYKEEQATEYPRVAFSVGPAPAQFEPGGIVAEGSIFDEALGEFGSFEGDDFYDDEY